MSWRYDEAHAKNVFHNSFGFVILMMLLWALDFVSLFVFVKFTKNKRKKRDVVVHNDAENANENKNDNNNSKNDNNNSKERLDIARKILLVVIATILAGWNVVCIAQQTIFQLVSW